MRSGGPALREISSLPTCKGPRPGLSGPPPHRLVPFCHYGDKEQLRGRHSSGEEGEGTEIEDEREERHTKIHLNEIDAPEWQKIVYNRQAWRTMVGKIDIYE